MNVVSQMFSAFFNYWPYNKYQSHDIWHQSYMRQKEIHILMEIVLINTK